MYIGNFVVLKIVLWVRVGNLRPWQHSSTMTYDVMSDDFPKIWFWFKQHLVIYSNLELLLLVELFIIIMSCYVSVFKNGLQSYRDIEDFGFIFICFAIDKMRLSWMGCIRSWRCIKGTSYGMESHVVIIYNFIQGLSMIVWLFESWLRYEI